MVFKNTETVDKVQENSYTQCVAPLSETFKLRLSQNMLGNYINKKYYYIQFDSLLLNVALDSM